MLTHKAWVHLLVSRLLRASKTVSWVPRLLYVKLAYQILLSMEAVNKNIISSQPTLQKVMASFFERNSPESVQVLFWKIFQCWVTKDCKIRGELSDAELALVLDQLLELVTAAQSLYRNSNVFNTGNENHPEGKSHD